MALLDDLWESLMKENLLQILTILPLPSAFTVYQILTILNGSKTLNQMKAANFSPRVSSKPLKRRLLPFIAKGGAFLILTVAPAGAVVVIFPGTMYLDTSLVTHGQEFATNRWAIDATGTIKTAVAGADTVSFDYSAKPTPYGNWSIGGPAQGTNNIFSLPFTAGNLSNVVDVNGATISLVDGMAYRLTYMIKPSEFSYGEGLGTWAIGQGNTYAVTWNYNGNVGSSSVIAEISEWRTVSFDFTYQAGINFVLVSQSLNGGAPTVSRISGSGGPTPGANLDAPTIQFAGASPVPEPSMALLASLTTFLFISRRSREV